MTPLQKNRALTVAKKAARVLAAHRTPPMTAKRLARLLDEIANFFDRIEHEGLRYFEGWDQRDSPGNMYLCDYFDEVFGEEYENWKRIRTGYRRDEYEQPGCERGRDRFLADLRVACRLAINLTAPAQDGVPGVVLSIQDIRAFYPHPAKAPSWWRQKVLGMTLSDWESGQTTIFAQAPDEWSVIL